VPDEVEPRFEVEVPPELENGAYANFLAVWHTAHDFTLDFALTAQPKEGEGAAVVPCRVVARVKIPVTVAEDMLRALATNLTLYENAAGRIRRPGEDLHRRPPDEG
jgi:Protein of unknown function (DUF3467)